MFGCGLVSGARGEGILRSVQVRNKQQGIACWKEKIAFLFRHFTSGLVGGGGGVAAEKLATNGNPLRGCTITKSLKINLLRLSMTG